jgi:hypothetical protein
MFLENKGEVKVRVYLSPTLNFHNSQGLRYGVSFDDDPPEIINMHAQDSKMAWESWVSANINTVTRPGEHVLIFWMVDPGVVLQKLVVETKEIRPSYLGPPESFHSIKIFHNPQ